MQLTESWPSSSNKIDLTNLEDLSIYVGGSCNFNCSYCDRSYVKFKGIQKMEFGQDIAEFVFDALKENPNIMISFHGGETLIYVSFIKNIIDSVLEKGYSFTRFFIQTNGSLILKNREFFEDYRNNLFVSISYDFNFQQENRTDFDINQVLQFLNENSIGVQLQFVLPSYRPEAFGLPTFNAIVELYRKFKIGSLNLILLRHTRHLDYFETVICRPEINLEKIFRSFYQFIQLLYVAGINVVVDGHTSKLDKDYFSNHKQIVLSPDGYIYPEYQFIEYKDPSFRVGQWKNGRSLIRNSMPIESKSKMRRPCSSCNLNTECGLQYYYAMFGIDPHDQKVCQKFYLLMGIAIRHSLKLKKSKGLLELVGI